MVIVLAILLYVIPVIPLGWQSYVKAKADKIWIQTVVIGLVSVINICAIDGILHYLSRSPNISISR